MVDFTNLPPRKKAYDGANGSKLSVVYDDELYMLKLPTTIKSSHQTNIKIAPKR